MEKPKFYITTPIYYPSTKLHIGHTYCTVEADAIARFKRLLGYDVRFLTGTDEHGQKIEKYAAEHNMQPKEYVDMIVAGILDLWKLMNISNDDFIRTTDDRHVAVVQKIFKRLYDQGDIYKSEYEGWYCTPCESFWLDRQLVDGKCPDCGRPVQRTKEESYFFRLSKYADRLIDYINSHPDFIQPESRKNEMMNNFLLPGLEDLAVSRTSFKWGIPVTFDEKHVVYVWIDALSNYISALGYGSDDDTLYQKYWPADLHLVGKEIIRFHTIIWPIMLMALDLPLPKQIYGHGWVILEGGKMSKSRGNVVDPVVLAERYGVDALRYFLLREMPIGSDGLFTNEILINRINADLANDLGNLLSRTVAMVGKYFDGKITRVLTDLPEDVALRELAAALPEKAEQLMEGYRVSDVLAETWKYIGAMNKYIDVTEPWVLARDPEKQARLAAVLYELAEGLRIVAVMITPFLPDTAAEMFTQLGIKDDALKAWDSIKCFAATPDGTVVAKGKSLFPRMDVNEELAALEALNKKPEPPKEDAPVAPEKEPALPQIEIDALEPLDLRTGKVIACENLKRSNKLLKLTVDMGGGETRTILSGIRSSYSAEDMIGKTIIVVANLKPAKLCGVVSEGMALAVGDGEGISLLTTDKPAAPGLRAR